MRDKYSDNEKDYMQSYHIEDYDRPSLATDMVVFTIKSESSDNYRKLSQKELAILLIQRGEHPFKGQWALPGGFVRKGETIEESAIRELRDETGVTDMTLSQLHTFSEPDRDPRGWIISCAYMALAQEDRFKLKAGTDAVAADWFYVDFKLENTESKKTPSGKIIKRKYKLSLTSADITLSSLIEIRTHYTIKKLKTEYIILKSDGIAFDHGKIIAYAINTLRENINNSLLAFELLPEHFTLTELQTVYEKILDKDLVAANFRRKIADYVIETDMKVKGGGHRPSKLYKCNYDAFLA